MSKATERQGNIALAPGEFYGMEHHSGYKRYYVFGVNLLDMFKRVVKMYNSYAGTRYNTKQFMNVCKEEDHYCFLYKFTPDQLQNVISFDDDCYSMGEMGGTELGDYLKMYGRRN